MEQQQTEAPLNQIRLKQTELHIDARFDRVDGQLKLNRWMLVVLLAGVISLILKTLF
jgi:hypothetical protein